MGDLYLNVHSIQEELVGIVGMLSSRAGSTLKEITSLLESLHGPVRRDMIQDGLRSAVSSGMLVCNNRRYKVCKQKNISESDSLFDLEDCSSYKADSSEYVNMRDNYTASDSSISAQMDGYLEEESSRAPTEYYSVEEILSVKSLSSSRQLSAGANLNKQRKTKGKKRIVVKLPEYKKKSTVENDTSVENSGEKLESEQEVSKSVETPETLENNTEDNTGSSKNVVENLHVKRSINDEIGKVMRNLSQKNKPNENEHLDKGAVPREGGIEREASNGAMSKVMAEVMKKIYDTETSETLDISSKVQSEATRTVISDEPGSTRSSEPLNRDDEKSVGVKFLSDIMKRIYGGESGLSQDPPAVLKNDNLPVSSDNKPNSNTTSRSAETYPLDAVPSTSWYTPKSMKREKRAKPQQTDSCDLDDDVGYFTRSRARARDLRRSRTQSPSNSDASAKRAKLQ